MGMKRDHIDLKAVTALDKLPEKNRRLVLALVANTEFYPAKRSSDGAFYLALIVLAVVMASSFFS